MYFPNEFKAQKNKLLGSLEKLEKQWKLSFEVKPPGTISSGWSNIIHATAGDNCCAYGQRIPGLWFHGSHSTRLYIANGVGSNGDRTIWSASISPSLWSTIELTQKFQQGKFMYTVTINGATELSEENTNPREFLNVDIFASDDFYTTSGASIRKLIYENLSNDGSYHGEGKKLN